MTVTFIGAGGVSWSLAQALAMRFEIRQVFSRDIANAQRLTNIVGGDAVDAPEKILPGADLYVVALADHAVADVIARLQPSPESTWVLTSGSLPKETLERLSPSIGVFYPLQTFTRGLSVDFADVPIFIEGSTKKVENRLREIGRSISRSVHRADAALRKQLHIAGVMSCNFVNYLWGLTDDLLRRQGLTMDVVRPLISQTLAKTAVMQPRMAQTGPARRADFEVMRSHLAELPPDQAEVYRFMSNQILKLYFPDDESYRL